MNKISDKGGIEKQQNDSFLTVKLDVNFLYLTLDVKQILDP